MTVGFHHNGRVILAVNYGLSTGGTLHVMLNSDGEPDYGTVRHGDPTKRVVQLKPGDTVTGKFGTATVTSVTVAAERPDKSPSEESRGWHSPNGKDA